MKLWKPELHLILMEVLQTNPDGSIKTWTRTRAVCGKILFDVNGNKNPN